MKREYNQRLIFNLLIAQVQPSKMSTVGEEGNATREENPGCEELCGHTEGRQGKGAPQRGDSPNVPVSQGRAQGIYPKQLSECREPA